jgi:hypothetical protein
MEKEFSGLQNVLRKLDPCVVALYTLVGDDKFQIIVVTPEVMQTRECPIAAKELRNKVFQFRKALLNYNSDPLPLAQELYGILLGPVATTPDLCRKLPPPALYRLSNLRSLAYPFSSLLPSLPYVSR